MQINSEPGIALHTRGAAGTGDNSPDLTSKFRKIARIHGFKGFTKQFAYAMVRRMHARTCGEAGNNLEYSSRKGGYGDAVASALLAAAVLYFSYAALQGDHGLFRLIQVEAQEQQLRIELAELSEERAAIANKARRMSNSYLDLDLLDEQARRILGMARGDEIIIR